MVIVLNTHNVNYLHVFYDDYYGWNHSNACNDSLCNYGGLCDDYRNSGHLRNDDVCHDDDDVCHDDDVCNYGGVFDHIGVYNRRGICKCHCVWNREYDRNVYNDGVRGSGGYMSNHGCTSSHGGDDDPYIIIL